MQSRVAAAGGPIHYEDFGGSGPALVLVHGLGGGAVNWRAVAPALAARARVVALDLVGFGRTPPEGRSARVPANRQSLDRFLDAVVGAPAILVGNSMGGLLALMEASVEPAKVAGLVLVAPALPPPWRARIDPAVWAGFALYSLPGVAEWYLRRRQARLGADGVVREVMRLLCADPARVPADIRAAHVGLVEERLARMPWANRTFLEAARSLVGLLRRRRRFARMVAGIQARALVIHGTRDRLVPLAAAEGLARQRPDWALDVFPDVGHVPMLEAAGPFVASVTRWLDGPGRTAAARAAEAPAAPSHPAGPDITRRANIPRAH
jgi:glycerol-3-phosphate dehydrogenase